MFNSKKILPTRVVVYRSKEDTWYYVGKETSHVMHGKQNSLISLTMQQVLNRLHSERSENQLASLQNAVESTLKNKEYIKCNKAALLLILQQVDSIEFPQREFWIREIDTDCFSQISDVIKTDQNMLHEELKESTTYNGLLKLVDDDES